MKVLNDSFSPCFVGNGMGKMGIETSESSSKNLIRNKPSKLLNDLGGSFWNQSNANPLRELTKSHARTSPFLATFPVRFRSSMSVESEILSYQNSAESDLELRKILSRITFFRIRSAMPGFSELDSICILF